MRFSLFLLLLAAQGLYGQLPTSGRDSIPWWKTTHVLDMTTQCQRADLDTLLLALAETDRKIVIRSVYPSDFVAHSHRDTLQVLLHCSDRSDILPASIGKVKNLYVLDLSFDIYFPKQGNITCLPREIGNLTNLRELNLEGNSLQRLPPSMANLKQLRVLNLANNLFQEFPEVVAAMPSLQVLRLDCLKGYNGFSFVPPSVGQMQALKVLILSGNKIAYLPDEIGDLKNLEELDLSHNTTLQSLPHSITKLKKLKKLDLTATGLSARTIARLRGAMPWCTIVS